MKPVIFQSEQARSVRQLLSMKIERELILTTKRIGHSLSQKLWPRLQITELKYIRDCIDMSTLSLTRDARNRRKFVVIIIKLD